MKYIFFIAVIIRILTQAIGGDDGYFIGVYLFDICSLIYLAVDKKGIERKILFFLAGTACYDFIKPLFREPDLNYLDEFFTFQIGLILTLTEKYIIQFYNYVFSNNSKRP